MNLLFVWIFSPFIENSFCRGEAGREYCISLGVHCFHLTQKFSWRESFWIFNNPKVLNNIMSLARSMICLHSVLSITHESVCVSKMLNLSNLVQNQNPFTGLFETDLMKCEIVYIWILLDFSLYSIQCSLWLLSFMEPLRGLHQLTCLNCFPLFNPFQIILLCFFEIFWHDYLLFTWRWGSDCLHLNFAKMHFQMRSMVIMIVALLMKLLRQALRTSVDIFVMFFSFPSKTPFLAQRWRYWHSFWSLSIRWCRKVCPLRDVFESLEY